MTSQVLLATSHDWPDGEPEHEVLDAALAARGLTSAWVAWDDPEVDWAAADAVAVRSTWDYETRREEFLQWAEGVGPGLLNGAALFRWNTDKQYLLDLAERTDLPVVPTTGAATTAEVAAAVQRYGASVVKPRVGAGGRGLVVVGRGGAATPEGTGPWIVQPLVESVRTAGETSVFVVAGRPVGQVRKVATAADVRVHPYHGGTSARVALDAAAADLALGAVEATAGLVGAVLDYARVDLLLHEGRLCVSEVEVTEPGLYLDLVPENGDALADAIAARL